MNDLLVPPHPPNTPPSKAQILLDQVSVDLRQLKDARKPGNNLQYSMHDAACSAFSVFYTQSPSFLSYQREMTALTGRNNVQSLFGAHDIPTDVQIRNILDPVDPDEIAPIIRAVGDRLLEEKCLDGYRVLNGTFLVALDGTDTFSSTSKIFCPSCHTSHHKDGTVLHRHIAVTPALVAPGEPRVVGLPPEFVTPQDGHEKQDCERAAAIRWVEKWGAHYAPWGITLLGDDLYANPPFCEKILAAGFDFLLTCKSSSHPTTAEWVEDFAREGAIKTLVLSETKGKRKTVRHQSTYRFIDSIPLRDSDDALMANWLEITVTNEDGKILYHNTWITSHPVTPETVADLAKAGRARWKIENEHIATLKIGGYHLEHNFGHGQKNLSNVLASLNLLAYLLHTACEWIDVRYRTLRFRLGSRVAFFHKFTALLDFFCFENWDHLIGFMFGKLRVDSG